MKPRTKYDRAAEKNVKVRGAGGGCSLFLAGSPKQKTHILHAQVLLGAFGDFLGGLTGPASDLEDRSEEDEEDEDATTAPAFPEKQRPAQKKKRKSVALSSSESDPSDPADEEEEEERPRPSKKKKKQRKSASATGAAEKGTKASRASLSKSESKEEPTSAKSGKRKSSEQSRPAAAAKEEITITDSGDSDSGADAIPKTQQQPVASTSKATPPPPAMMSMRDSDLSEVEDTGFLPGARRRSCTKGTKKGAKGKGKVVGTDEEEEEEGRTTTSGRKGKGTASSKEQKNEEGKKKQKVERKAPAPKPGDAPKGTDAEEARIKKLKVRPCVLRLVLPSFLPACCRVGIHVRNLPPLSFLLFLSSFLSTPRPREKRARWSESKETDWPDDACTTGTRHPRRDLSPIHSFDRRRTDPDRLATDRDPRRAVGEARVIGGQGRGEEAAELEQGERGRGEESAREGDAGACYYIFSLSLSLSILSLVLSDS